MRYLIIFIIAYFLVRMIRNLVSQIKIVPRDSMNVKESSTPGSQRMKVDRSNIEDADFKEVE